MTADVTVERIIDPAIRKRAMSCIYLQALIHAIDNEGDPGELISGVLLALSHGVERATKVATDVLSRAPPDPNVTRVPLMEALAAAEQRGREDEREARVKVERWLDETLIEWSRGTTYQTGCPVDVHEWWDRYARGDS